MDDKKFAWELFKTTGNIDAYMLMKDVEYSEELINQNMDGTKIAGEKNGINKSKGNSNKSC